MMPEAGNYEETRVPDRAQMEGGAVGAGTGSACRPERDEQTRSTWLPENNDISKCLRYAANL